MDADVGMSELELIYMKGAKAQSVYYLRKPAMGLRSFHINEFQLTHTNVSIHVK